MFTLGCLTFTLTVQAREVNVKAETFFNCYYYFSSEQPASLALV